MLLVTILFSLVRPHNTVVYAPKTKHADETHKPPRIGSAPLAWLAPITRTKEETLIEKIGLDAAIFLRFLKMCRNMFLALSIFGCMILVPIHVITTRNQLANLPTPAGADPVTQALIAITPLNVTGLPLWSHVATSYVIDIVVMFFLWLNYRAITKLKRSYFNSKEYQQSLHSRSIWMTDIPRAERSDEGILRICDSVEQTPNLPRAAIARDVKKLPILIKEHDKAVRELESVLAKYLKNPDQLPVNRPVMRPYKKHRQGSGKVDAIEYLTKEVADLEVQIKDIRQSIDKRNPEQYGFATYDRIEDAHVVAYEGRKKKPSGVRIRLAPRPNDLIWENLSLSKKTRARKRIVFSFWIFLLTLIYIIPNALIAAFLSNLGNLAAVWPAFALTYTNDKVLWQFVQAVLSPALLSLVYLLMPILFRRWSQSAGDLTKTSREQHVIQKLYVFFVFNNLIVFSVFSTLFGFVLKVIGATSNGEDAWKAIRESDIANLLLKTLCAVSNFWLIWLIQRNVGAAIDLAQLINLVYVWFMRTFMAPTPRQAIEWTAPPPFDYASYYNWFIFYVTVALCFATVQPLVLLVTFVYFLIDTWLKRYLLLYIFITKTESGGQFWNIVFNRILFATFMANCVAALVIKGCWGQWGASIGNNLTAYYMMGSMIPLPLMLLGFKIFCEKTYGDQTRYFITTRTNVEGGSINPTKRIQRSNDRIGKKFGHPALYKKLIRPMVHEKAQHMLEKLFSGRIDQEQGDSGYADIEMIHMKSGPASGSDARNLFEVVPENALDFANFKNRADFAEEHGGDGELYGRPEDFVSERSRTPMSAMSDDDLSRAGTPTPMPLGRYQSPPDLQNHPAYRQQTQESMYNYNNDSQRSLLATAAGPVQYAPIQGHHQPHEQQQQYPQQQGGVPRFDRWRTAGSGYVGVAGQADEDDTGYEAYRPPTNQQTSYRGYRGA